MRITTFLVSLSFAAIASAGPIVTTTSNASVLANTLLGSGVTLSGTPTLTAAGPQAGTFVAGPSLLGIGSGIVLSSGDASSAAGNYAGQNLPDTAEGGAGDAALSALIGGQDTNDAAILNFSFVPTAGTIFFNYVFASAEYPNYVGQFNDVFGFFVNGTNCATVPGTTTPVSINNVNTTTNSAFFNQLNSAGDTLPYGGETKVLTCSATVNPGVVNTISLGVADALDEALDSAVFIQAGSLGTVNPSPSPEPVSVGLFGLGLVACGGLMYRRNQKVSAENSR